MIFVYEVNGVRFEWQGGEYIDVLSRHKTHPNQEEALWIDNATMRSGWYYTDIGINVWDHSNDRPTISRTQKAFEKFVNEWRENHSRTTE